MKVEFVLLWLAAAMTVCGQIPGGPEIGRAQSDAYLHKPVIAGGSISDILEQEEDPLADARDGELLGRTLHNRGITQEESADMEAAALRRLERRKARMTKLERLVGS